MDLDFLNNTNHLKQNTGKTYEVVGSSYGLDDVSFPDLKQREDVLKLKRYVQIMDLPYPNHNGLIGK